MGWAVAAVVVAVVAAVVAVVVVAVVAAVMSAVVAAVCVCLRRGLLCPSPAVHGLKYVGLKDSAPSAGR